MPPKAVVQLAGCVIWQCVCCYCSEWGETPPLFPEHLKGVEMACKELWFGRPRPFCQSLSHKLTNNSTSPASDLPSSISLHHPQPSSYSVSWVCRYSVHHGSLPVIKLDRRGSGSTPPSCLSSAEHVTLWRLSGLEN